MPTDDSPYQSDSPPPPVRPDIQISTLNYNGEEILAFQDMLGYIPAGFALHRHAEPILSLLNGRLTVSKIRSILNNQVSTDEIFKFIELLDRNSILDSETFQKTSAELEARFETAPVRPPTLAGEIYPDSGNELYNELSIQFDKVEESEHRRPLKALYAPHIDPRVHETVYAEAFTRIRHLKPERIVILATSHYAGLYPDTYHNKPFIGSKKSYKLPHRTFTTDRNYLDRLTDKAGESGFTTNDRAHRIEHSIELHLLYASHIWQHEFTIVPILVNSLDELFYMRNGHLGKQLRYFAELLQELDTEDTFYLISGDLSHVGKKFGDTEAAEDIRNKVEASDQQFMTLATTNRQDELLSKLQHGQNPYRICGFPPLFTWLTAFPDAQGESINYYWWDEPERESAVSFGSILY
ncbi:MAG: AmmeMemoRadiSam system protein B [Balneolaceae bacterium]